MNYWILKHNPDIFNASRRRSIEVPQNIDYYRIRYYASEVSKDDLAFIWHTGVESGIHDVARILSAPPHNSRARERIDLMWENDLPCYDPDSYTRLGRYDAVLIECRYRVLEPPILLNELKQEGFGNLPVIRQPRFAGIYKLDRTQGERLLRYIQGTR